MIEAEVGRTNAGETRLTIERRMQLLKDMIVVESYEAKRASAASSVSKRWFHSFTNRRQAQLKSVDRRLTETSARSLRINHINDMCHRLYDQHLSHHPSSVHIRLYK